MFHTLRLRTQLSIGFTTIITLLIIVSVTAYWGLSGAFDGFTEYRRLAGNANKVSEFQDRMLNVRLTVRGFIAGGSEQAEKDYRERFDAMMAVHKVLMENIKTPERARIVATVGDQIKQYHQAFNQLMEFNQQRHEAIMCLNTAGPIMRQAVTKIIQAAAKNNNAEGAVLSGELQEQVMLGRLYMAKYLESHRDEGFQRAKEEIQIKVDELSRALNAKSKDTILRELLASSVLAKPIAKAGMIVKAQPVAKPKLVEKKPAPVTAASEEWEQF